MIGKRTPVEYDTADQMIISAAHQIRDKDAIYVGLGLPMVAALLAKHTHAPHCTIIIENGIIRTKEFPLPASTDTVGSQTFADNLGGLFYVNCLGQAGFINLGFLGAGQIDRHGNVNDTVIGDYKNPVYRFPGGGGGNDVMSFCKKTCVIVRQSKRRFPEKVDFITCAGYLDGEPGQREAAGLSADTGPASVITNLGCYEFENREMVLKTVHTGCGVTLEKVREEVGWDLKVASDLKDTVPPTSEEIRILREVVDPNKIWAGGKRTVREDSE
jgi:acyl CoA:acetate/3-ketoacid CoA transferase beta subunit